MQLSDVETSTHQDEVNTEISRTEAIHPAIGPRVLWCIHKGMFDLRWSACFASDHTTLQLSEAKNVITNLIT